MKNQYLYQLQFPGFAYRTKCNVFTQKTNAANAIGNLKDTNLSNFVNRVCYRKGRTVDVSATVRKLAVIIWNMVAKQISYQTPTKYLFLGQKKNQEW